jgi:LuxR family transcriptional regulator, maltose regulon positive regulatory protein
VTDLLGGEVAHDLATAGGHLVAARPRQAVRVTASTGDAVPPTARSGTAALPAPAVVVSRAALFGRLGTTRVTTVSAPAGSGKTFLLRSWISESGLGERAAWVAVKGAERCPEGLWMAVADALRATPATSALVRPLTAAPDLDGRAILERLLEDLARLDQPVWLVIDDVHELTSDDALSQLQLMIMRSSPELRFVLLARHDLPLSLHRLRVEGQLSDIRAAELSFSLAEARALFEAAGVQLPEPALAQLHARAEGWAAGLRLAAMSLAGHPDPERFAAEFSGSERTVAEYLLAEVLERQPDEVQRLLLRTSVLQRVHGELADLLTGGSGSQRILNQLEAGGAFVNALDAGRSWFRYHPLFADLLQAELRRIAPGEPLRLHATAAEWFAEHGYPLDAVRHAQAAQDWVLAARLLADHWVDLWLDGRADTVHELLAGFPSGIAAADAELTALKAGQELARGSRAEADRQLALASQLSGSVPADRRERFQVVLAVVKLSAAQRRGDLWAVAQQADRLRTAVEAPNPTQLAVGEDLRALAMISLGIATACAAGLEGTDRDPEDAERRLEQADRHLEQGVALARRIGRPYLELVGLAHGAVVACCRGAVAGLRSRQAIDLAARHGWGEEQAAGHAYLALGAELVSQGQLEEAEPWIDHAATIARSAVSPAFGIGLHAARGLLELAVGRHEQALADFQAGARLAARMMTPPTLATDIRACALHTLLRLGQTERAEAILAGLDEHERATPQVCTAVAMLRIAQQDPRAASVALAPLVEGSGARMHPIWSAAAWLLEAVARDALGDPDSAGRALEHALDIAEPGRWILPFLVHPAPSLLERHAQGRTAHAALIGDILSRIGGTSRPARPHSRPADMREPLSQAESRVLRYLPTSLSVPEIARELYLSVNTVRTHMRHIYGKLDAHRRHEAIERARALGLVAPGRS